MLLVKKIFIISTILLLVIVIFFGIYTIAFKPKNVSRDVVKDEDKGYLVDIEGVVSDKLTNVTSESVVAATVGPDGNTVRYISGLDGRVYTMTLRGSNKEVLYGETKGVPRDVKWSDGGTASIEVYDDGIYVTNYTTQTTTKLRDGMDDVVWAGNGGKILYKYYDDATQERSLNLANADGTNWKKIADLPYRYTSFTQIPSSILAAFWPKEDISIESSLHTVSTINERQEKVVVKGGYGVDYLFSPNGKKILVSKVNDGNFNMGVMDANGENYVDLMIPTTVNKAVWSKDSKTVYYTQPLDIPEGSTLPQDYNDKKFTTHDTFFKVNISDGKKERLIELENISEKIDAEKLFVSPTEDMLFFINRNNGLLYRISL